MRVVNGMAQLGLDADGNLSDCGLKRGWIPGRIYHAARGSCE